MIIDQHEIKQTKTILIYVETGDAHIKPVTVIL